MPICSINENKEPQKMPSNKVLELEVEELELAFQLLVGEPPQEIPQELEHLSVKNWLQILHLLEGLEWERNRSPVH
jgi:hypothetical protein